MKLHNSNLVQKSLMASASQLMINYVPEGASSGSRDPFPMQMIISWKTYKIQINSYNGILIGNHMVSYRMTQLLMTLSNLEGLFSYLNLCK